MIALLSMLLASEPAAAPARFVIVVGWNAEATADRPALAYADDDAARFFAQQSSDAERAWLLTTFDADSARSYPDLAAVARPPTREELARVLGEAAWLIRAMKDRGRMTELVFSFAGHGDVSAGGEGYLLMADGPFTRSELSTQVVRGSPADVNHVVLDACASYFMVTPRGEAEAPAVALTPKLLDALRGVRDDDPAWARTGVIVSTSSAAAVHESADVGGGVFSYLLRSALAGGADGNGDGRVEYAEAAAFIAASSREIPDARARLHVHARAPLQRPNAALADVSLGSSSRYLFVDSERVGRVRILDGRGVPWAELHREEHSPVLVRLPADPFLVVQIGEREAVLVPRKAGAYALSSLSFEVASKPRAGPGTLHHRLFETPFGPTFLTGFLAASDLPTPFSRPPITVPFVAGAEPPLRLPLREGAVFAFAGAGVLTIAAVVCIGGNLIAFAELSRQFEEGASFESQKAWEVEAWRTGATATGIGAIAVSVAGGGLWLAATLDDERAP